MTTARTAPSTHDVAFRTAIRGSAYVARVVCDCGDFDIMLEHTTSRVALMHIAASEYHNHIMHSDKWAAR